MTAPPIPGLRYGIRGRKTDDGVARGGRVSLTHRKVRLAA